MPSKTGSKTPPAGGSRDRDALKQGVPSPDAPSEERTYEDAQDAAFDPRGDRATPDGQHDKGRG